MKGSSSQANSKKKLLLVKLQQIAFAILAVALGIGSFWLMTIDFADKPMDCDDQPNNSRCLASGLSIQPGVYRFRHYDYQMNPDFSLASWDHQTIVETEYQTWVIENNFLRLEVLPEFGGRIISMVNKTTGHESLYQNPVGTPYLMDQGVFYYDWLMIMGGIFPTVREAEHGVAWNRPWRFELIEHSPERITIAMTYTDKDDFAGKPGNYRIPASELEVSFYVSLHRDRAAVDTITIIGNPTNNTPEFEHWTLLTMAPGSEPGNTRVDESLMQVGPVSDIHLPDFYWDNPLEWDEFRWFKNQNEGIAYAKPGMQGSNYWGAVNQANREGLIRIADNNITPGLKNWSFGFDSLKVDPEAGGEVWHRPTVEMWAGVTPQFWIKDQFPAEGRMDIDETFVPTVGLSDVSHANEKLLFNLIDGELQLYFIEPGQPYNVQIVSKGEVVFDQAVEPNPYRGNRLEGAFGPDAQITIHDAQGQQVFPL
ncbi:DUF5107 domain-containing protein [Aliagarivorans taiwanensis]|uniref:DUF5107 domain-containing protein n=1 Tax=Aliagarivorans taiwanensis TaxID=561966 RepID=UPI00040CC26C|nr:DUF5107 domain-containing protein [Aliagarivorans taiwanensis]